MKEILKSMWEYSPLKLVYDNHINILNKLLLALQLWCVNLSIYFTAIFIGFMFCILTGEGNFFEGVFRFTRAYFYDGHLPLFGFITWRVHLTIYIFCIFIILTERE